MAVSVSALERHHQPSADMSDAAPTTRAATAAKSSSV